MSYTALELTESLKTLFQETAQNLKGTQRRQFMAKVVEELNPGGASLAEKELGWNRGTIRKGQYERKHGAIEDQFSERGRKPNHDVQTGRAARVVQHQRRATGIPSE